jgi:hypothetical protein
MSIRSFFGLFLVTVNILSALNSQVSACPYVPPKSLLTLYKTSDLIVVARASSPMVVKKEEDYTQIKIPLQITDTLKGESESTIFIFDDVWGKDRPSLLTQGKPILAFLKKSDKENNLYKGVDGRSSIDPLSEEEIVIYKSRISELANVLNEEHLDKAKLIDWIIRCIEEKATRWHGAYMLVNSFNAFNIKQEEESKLNQEPNLKTITELAANIKISWIERQNSEYSEERNLELFENLTDEDKGRVIKVFFESKEMDSGKQLLFDLIKQWDKQRLFPYLLSSIKLHYISEENMYSNYQLMQFISEALDNEELKDIVEKYNDIYYEKIQPLDEEGKETEMKKSKADESGLLQKFISLAGALSVQPIKQ